jgi:transposase-like protein
MCLVDINVGFGGTAIIVRIDWVAAKMVSVKALQAMDQMDLERVYSHIY